MVLGLLYRSILDELTGASKTIRLCIHLDHHLGNHVPDFNVFSVQVRPRIFIFTTQIIIYVNLTS
jgi:hypothetical protein